MADFGISTDVLTMFDDKSYSKLAMGSADTYKKNRPFPHIKMDNFLPFDLAYRISTVFPDRRNKSWTVHSNVRADRKFVGDETKVDPLFRLFMQATASRQFLLFLETLTGIEGLIPDPYHIGGGAMTAGRGDKLDMHIDFNWHYKLHAHRRCNALFYLTPGWKVDWGGALRLGVEEPVEYVPVFNRLIVFSTTETSWHGQPVPLACPSDTLRQVFSAFYYTAASEAETADPHLTRYHDTTPYTEKPLKEYQS
jgi:2OG-Fe(II) oxygenase superfamily